ncbi:hypothetical protein PsYK624_042350 [Phanerochaete sordida]|uniref:Uncharacterized protein n=1 Tax=Phanerochaete sordida TaxID=48140 RepID=A0A9P3LBT0_9APHY|nr:hypothetical protein PsYK624_042350 [Phanerochaete sordida]
MLTSSLPKLKPSRQRHGIVYESTSQVQEPPVTRCSGAPCLLGFPSPHYRRTARDMYGVDFRTEALSQILRASLPFTKPRSARVFW